MRYIIRYLQSLEFSFCMRISIFIVYYQRGIWDEEDLGRTKSGVEIAKGGLNRDGAASSGWKEMVGCVA